MDHHRSRRPNSQPVPPWGRAAVTLVLLLFLAMAGGVQAQAGLWDRIERSAGEAAFPEMVARYGGVAPLPEEHQAWLNAIFERVAAQSSRTGAIEYSLTVLNTDLVNAFALPGGFVFLHPGPPRPNRMGSRPAGQRPGARGGPHRPVPLPEPDCAAAGDCGLHRGLLPGGDGDPGGPAAGQPGGGPDRQRVVSGRRVRGGPVGRSSPPRLASTPRACLVSWNGSSRKSGATRGPRWPRCSGPTPSPSAALR